MKIATKIFGEIEIADDKIIVFPNGIIGFPDLNRFSLMYDKDKGSHNIQWLQSLDEPAFAMAPPSLPHWQLFPSKLQSIQLKVE